MSSSSERLRALRRHLTGARDSEPRRPPVVRPSAREFSKDPLPVLKRAKEQYPDMFIIERSPGNRYVVVCDPELFEDVLTFDDIYGPFAPNMSVNNQIFNIPQSVLDTHETTIVKKLRRFLLNHCDDIADDIGRRVTTYIRENLKDEGVIDMRDIGTAVFWPMTEALFGSAASKERAPHLLKAFDGIDGKFGKALRGRHVPEVVSGVREANVVFEESVRSARKGQCPMAPLLGFYEDELKDSDSASPNLTAKFATAAWWGGQGNTLPSTVWTFGLLLKDPEWKRRVYEEVDRNAAFLPSPDGKFSFDKLAFITAALKESLRIKTYSIAWRQMRKDAVVTGSKTGEKYLLKKGELVGIHFCLQHMDEAIYPDPKRFDPTRFLGKRDGRGRHRYDWAPFSAGFHKCSGYPLAMLEIPVVIALMFLEYDMELLDDLPGMDYKQAFGVVGPTDKPVRVRYKRRAH